MMMTNTHYDDNDDFCVDDDSGHIGDRHEIVSCSISSHSMTDTFLGTVQSNITWNATDDDRDLCWLWW